MNRKMNLESIKECVYGKHIAVVGNARALVENGTDKLPIDDYEVVVRINKPVISNRTGFRTDVLFLAQRNAESHIVNTVKPTWICWTRPEAFQDIPKSHIWLTTQPNVAVIPKDFLFAVHKRFGTKKATGVASMDQNRRVPSTGFLTLWYLFRECEPKWVDVWGFDFWLSGTTSTPGRSHPGPHDYPMERSILMGEKSWGWVDPRHNDLGRIRRMG